MVSWMNGHGQCSAYSAYSAYSGWQWWCRGGWAGLIMRMPIITFIDGNYPSTSITKPNMLLALKALHIYVLCLTTWYIVMRSLYLQLCKKLTTTACRAIDLQPAMSWGYWDGHHQLPRKHPGWCGGQPEEWPHGCNHWWRGQSMGMVVGRESDARGNSETFASVDGIKLLARNRGIYRISVKSNSQKLRYQLVINSLIKPKTKMLFNSLRSSRIWKGPFRLLPSPVSHVIRWSTKGTTMMIFQWKAVCFLGLPSWFKNLSLLSLIIGVRGLTLF